jgi:hypothetical protein
MCCPAGQRITPQTSPPKNPVTTKKPASQQVISPISNAQTEHDGPMGNYSIVLNTGTSLSSVIPGDSNVGRAATVMANLMQGILSDRMELAIIPV